MITLRDSHEIQDSINGTNPVLEKINGGPKGTKILIRDRETGKILQQIHNKITVPGGMVTCAKQFGLELPVFLPTYNKELELEHSHEEYEDQPYNTPITCLWCAGRDGYLSSPGEVVVVSNTDRIEPDDIVPFRYVTGDTDLDKDQREEYFGRKVMEDGHIAYYFKRFDTTPDMHVRYLDGTEVTDKMWTIDSSQQVEVYVEFRLAVSRLDFRDYFNKVLGWANADISTVSLLTAWYDATIPEDPEQEEEYQTRYRWYQDVLPFSKFNFKAEDLSELNRAIDFIYQIYY